MLWEPYNMQQQSSTYEQNSMPLLTPENIPHITKMFINCANTLSVYKNQRG